jgi:hypothetical protein
MKALVIAGLVVCELCLIGSSGAFASYRQGFLLTPSERRAYHVCLHEAWIVEWCRANSAVPTATWGRVYPACVLANRGGRFPLVGWWYDNTDDYCWTAARHFR